MDLVCLIAFEEKSTSNTSTITRCRFKYLGFGVILKEDGGNLSYSQITLLIIIYAQCQSQNLIICMLFIHASWQQIRTMVFSILKQIQILEMQSAIHYCNSFNEF